jgi:acetyl/propionyl-CoA carboxylase alpha subunit
LSFVPSSGTITKFIVPEIEGIRVDTAMYSGYSIPVFYDSLIAKIISFANTRLEAIEKMKSSLMSFRITGIPSTIPFHISALNDARFIVGNYDTSFIEKLRPFSSKDGEIAAALISLLPKKIEFLNKEIREMAVDPWALSRFDTIDLFNSHFNINKWVK